MKFTYEANLLCESRFIHHSTCACVISGGPSPDVKVAQTSALAEATANGWLQIGDKVWCPSCAERRPDTEGMLQVRAGKFCPVTGLRVRFANPNAGLLGHQLTAHQNLTEGECYTVHTVLPGFSQVMVSLKEVPDLFFNCLLFEEALPKIKSKKGKA